MQAGKNPSLVVRGDALRDAIVAREANCQQIGELRVAGERAARPVPSWSGAHCGLASLGQRVEKRMGEQGPTGKARQGQEDAYRV
jgi:hypothetical protein